MLSGCKSYRFSSWKLSNDKVKAMLSRKKGGEESKKDVFFSLFVPHFLLDCVFLWKFFRSPNDKMSYSNVTSTEYTDCTFFWTRITQIIRMFSHRLHRFTQIFSWTTDADCTNYTDWYFYTLFLPVRTNKTFVVFVSFVFELSRVIILNTNTPNHTLHIFLNTNNANNTNVFPQIAQIYTDIFLNNGLHRLHWFHRYFLEQRIKTLSLQCLRKR